MTRIAEFFQLDSAPESAKIYGNGHINETYIVKTKQKKYILQKINKGIFTDVDGLMNNIELVTSHLSRRDPDPRHVLRPIRTLDGALYTAVDGEFWRMYDYVSGSICLEKVENAEDFETSGRAFGEFMTGLADFPADTLTETIKKFHDTPDRYRQLHGAILRDPLKRLEGVKSEVDFALAREGEASIMTDMLAKNELPLRVTHNDTKLNNVLLDEETRKPLCVIDLDTVMPGLAGNDFGDAIRFGASTAAEDERNLDNVGFSMELFTAYAAGYLSACGDSLTANELATLPLSARLMTLECGVRFLTDYLLGDTYFRTEYGEHNLIRCRTQFKLVRDMEKSDGAMRDAIDGILHGRNGNDIRRA